MAVEQQLKKATTIAVQTAQKAGSMARERFGTQMVVELKGDDGDLVTEVDKEADRLIVDTLRHHFPRHRIQSEEQGTTGEESDWRWLVDPLDGTNNYALGIPLYGVSLTLLFRQEPVLGVIHDSHLQQTYVARRGEGATVNGRPFRLERSHREPQQMTVGWIQGHHVQNHPGARHLFHSLDENFKRVLRTWAPALIWCMAARGDVDGIVLYDSEGEDLYAGILLMLEAGGCVLDFEGKPFTGMREKPYLIACHPEKRQFWLDWICRANRGRESRV